MDSKAKTQALIDYFNTTEKNAVEIYVDGLGWLVLLTENIEIVTDNWFTSTKYNACNISVVNEEASVIRLTNVYKINASFIDNTNNLKYNLMFDEINIYIDKVSAFF